MAADGWSDPQPGHVESDARANGLVGRDGRCSVDQILIPDQAVHYDVVAPMISVDSWSVTDDWAQTVYRNMSSLSQERLHNRSQRFTPTVLVQETESDPNRPTRDRKTE